MPSSPRILGIEGTAWAASAAIYDAATDELSMTTDAYHPERGGIHPREAAEHMQSAIPAVVAEILEAADDEIDAVAFSRGPGLGPCLRVVGTAARALSGRLDVPLVGVNHMLAHLEVGRQRAGFVDPIGLNASGANAHVLAFRGGRYRILGETMDTGVGNALDKFTRHVGWSHPGGPKVEAAAADGTYLELPYVVKGMDFSFSGITSAAKAASDDGAAVEDVCCGLQETIFAMLTEVAERALSLTDADELVLGGGVGQNARLQTMLETMCADRDAAFFAPEPALLRDNAGMIAMLGATMFAAGETIAVTESRVRPDYRPDEVAVSWRSPPPAPRRTDAETVQGAEAAVTLADPVIKQRAPKAYRHEALDARLRATRTASEARLTSAARRLGVPTPVVTDVDPDAGTLALQRVGDRDLRAGITEPRVREVARHLARLHAAGLVHGDPTPRNVRIPGPGAHETILIDFGLGYHSADLEDHAMDLHVLAQSLEGTTAEAPALRSALEAAYADAGDPRVIDRLRAIEGRGRYQ